MVVNFSNIDMKDKQVLILKNACEREIGVLGYAKGISPDLKYNEVSTIEFSVPEFVDGERTPFYDDIAGMQIVELKGVGQFSLVNPSENGDGVHKEKECKGYSLEYEFARKKITLPNGTYKFWDALNPENTLLGMIMELMPSWSVGNISDELIGKYRTFEVSNENLYNFIKGTVQQTYSCIFDFDTILKRVNIRKTSEQAGRKAVFLSTENLASEIEITEDTEGIVTRLDVNGADGVDIRDVNPCGTNKIIDLKYFMTTRNFEQPLIDKYNAWEALCEENRAGYYSLSVRYSLKVAQKIAEEASLTEKKNELSTFEAQQAVVIQGIAQKLATQDDLNAINEAIFSKQIEITEKKSEVDGYEAERLQILAQLKQIQAACSFDSYFTDEERMLLDRYIKDDEIAESSFVVSSSANYNEKPSGCNLLNAEFSTTNCAIDSATDTAGNTFYSLTGGRLSTPVIGLNADIISATFEKRLNGQFVFSAYLGGGSLSGNDFPSACVSYTGSIKSCVVTDDGIQVTIINGFSYFSLDASEYEKRSVAMELYEYGREVISRLSSPTYTFSITSANFFSLDEFETFKNEITLGEKVFISLDGESVLEPIFIGVRLNYESPESLELQFSDSYSSSDSAFKLVDLLEQSVSLGKSVDVNKYAFSSFIDSGASTGIKEFMESALDVSKNGILSSEDQAITWDKAGFRLRRWANDAHSAYDPEQIWMINNSIVMTDDAWETAKMAIGKFYDENLGDCWGIVAPRIVGTLIAGSSLVIESEKKDGGTAVFKMDGDGCRLFNTDLSVANSNSHIVLNPEIGFAIGTFPVYDVDEEGNKTINEENAKFWADDEGNLHMSGHLHAASGSFSGNISALSGNIGGENGWIIGERCIYNNGADTLGSENGIYLGHDGFSVGSAIVVEPDGSFCVRGSTDSEIDISGGLINISTNNLRVSGLGSGSEAGLEIMSLDPDGLTVKNVYVSNELSGPNVVTRHRGGTIPWCGSIQASINVCPKLLNGDATLIIPSGTYIEDVSIVGFSGGEITLFFSYGATLVGKIYMSCCDRVRITCNSFGDGRIYPQYNSTPVMAESVKMLTVEKMYISGYQGRTTAETGSPHAINISGGVGNISECKLDYARNAITFDWGATGCVTGCYGGCNSSSATTSANLNAGVAALNGSHVAINGTYPLPRTRTWISTIIGDGAVATGDGTTDDTYTPPSETHTYETKTYTCTSHCNYVTNTSESSGGVLSYQGRGSSYSSVDTGWTVGAIWFSGTNELYGNSVTSATLTFKRGRVGYGTVSISMGGWPYTYGNHRSVDFPYNKVEGAQTVATGVAMGDTVTVDVTPWINYLKQGYGIAFYEPRGYYNTSQNHSDNYTSILANGSDFEPVLCVEYSV